MRSGRRTILVILACTLIAPSVLLSQGSQSRREPDVPYVPTTPEAVAAMLKLAAVNKNDVLYDLGCGDGRIAIAAAKLYKARAVGIDINPEWITEAKRNALQAGVANLVRFEENDLFQSDIRKATVVTLFLLPNVNMRLRPKLLQDLRPGTRIVSNTFDMGDWMAEKELTLDGPEDEVLSRKLYLWRIPPRNKK